MNKGKALPYLVFLISFFISIGVVLVTLKLKSEKALPGIFAVDEGDCGRVQGPIYPTYDTWDTIRITNGYCGQYNAPPQSYNIGDQICIKLDVKNVSTRDVIVKKDWYIQRVIDFKDGADALDWTIDRDQKWMIDNKIDGNGDIQETTLHDNSEEISLAAGETKTVTGCWTSDRCGYFQFDIGFIAVNFLEEPPSPCPWGFCPLAGYIRVGNCVEPSPKSFVCQDLTRSPTVDLEVGDTVTFTCTHQAENVDLDHYEFRWSTDGGASYTVLDRTNTSGTSGPYTIDQAATYRVQCRVCAATGTTPCTDWGQAGGWVE